jgi:DNA-binding NarL/FixJ family response regulator
MNAVRMIIVTPDARIRSSFRSILEHDGTFTVVGEAGAGHAGLALARAQRPELVLIDSQLPGLSGAAIAAIVKRSAPDTVIAMLTPYTDFDLLVTVAQSGAATAVSRHADGETIIQTLKGVLGGLARLHPWAFPGSDLVVDLRADREAGPGIATALTDEQAAILDCLLIGMHVNEMPLALRTTGYRARKWYTELLEALDVNGKVGAISIAIERGWTDRGHRIPDVAVIRDAEMAPMREPLRAGPDVKTDRLRLTTFGEMYSFAS